jgi:two-component system, chemotaxis family, chemotaxis protein CheY
MSELLAPFGKSDFANDGFEAIKLVRHSLQNDQPYNLITLDIMMPEINGHETLQAIRQIEYDHGIFGLDSAKIIVTTSLHSSKDCIQAFRGGCESYLTKPISEIDFFKELISLNIVTKESFGNQNSPTTLAP